MGRFSRGGGKLGGAGWDGMGWDGMGVWILMMGKDGTMAMTLQNSFPGEVTVSYGVRESACVLPCPCLVLFCIGPYCTLGCWVLGIFYVIGREGGVSSQS